MKLIDRIIQHLKASDGLEPSDAYTAAKDQTTHDSSNYTIVFPNKRAGLFFRKNFKQNVGQHAWLPKIQSITEFIESHSPLQIADKFTLVFELYNAFEKFYKDKEPFAHFFFWGETLLADFDEIDKFLVDARVLFNNLSQLKMLEQDMSYLTEEQQAAIRKYWKHFGEKMTRQKQEALSIWKILPHVYEDYNKMLEAKQMAYQGKIYRQVAQNLDAITPVDEQVIFAGFNALSKAEEHIITWYCKERASEIFWEADDYYLNNTRQEAGKYLREIKNTNTVLGKTLEGSFGNNFPDDQKQVHVYEVSGEAAQAQVAHRIINDHPSWQREELEQTAIVLPDEQLMFPVLSALPEEVSDVNITMGYPLKNSAAYSFYENLIHLQVYRLKNKTRCFNHRYVKTLLYHPFITAILPQEAQQLVASINEQNKIYLRKDELDAHPILQQIFREINHAEEMNAYFLGITTALFDERDKLTDLEREFLLRFYKVFNQLKAFLEYSHLKLELKAFHRLLRQSILQERLPFEGEPLKGLQVMGLMETRNLSFKNIVLLSANEGVLPASKTSNISFIPQSFRKAFHLPTVDHFDGIYAYLFYRLVQYAENIHIVYNADTSGNRSGELSRFVKQLEWESGLPFQHHTVAPEIILNPAPAFKFTMNDYVKSKLMRYVVQNGQPERRFTPSAVNTYFDCSLRFYFRYIEDIYEEDEAEEDIDARRFGNLFHKIMEWVYEPYWKAGKPIEKQDINNITDNLDQQMDRVFREEFGLDAEETFEYQGKNVLVKEVLMKLAKKVLEKDSEYTPFEIVGLEQKGDNVDLDINSAWGPLDVGLKGVIDRIDKKDGVLRILDYKTGMDDKWFNDVPSLFNMEGSRNKAAFQTFFYALLYSENHMGNEDQAPETNREAPYHYNEKTGADHRLTSSFQWQLHSGLYNIRELFNDDFDYRLKYKGGRDNYLNDISGFLEEYKIYLRNFFEKIYNEGIVFEQTEDLKKCRFCPYAGLCKRETV